MADHGLRDRAFRFDVAGRLWDACPGCVSPERVREIADRLCQEVTGDDDPTELVRREVEAAGVPAERVPAIVSLVLLTKLAALRR